MSKVRKIVFSEKSKRQVRVCFFLLLAILIMLLGIRIGRKNLLSFWGRVVAAAIYEEYFPVAVYDRNILLTDIFYIETGELKQGVPLFFDGIQRRREQGEKSDTKYLTEIIEKDRNETSDLSTEKEQSQDEKPDYVLAMYTENSLFRENHGLENDDEKREEETVLEMPGMDNSEEESTSELSKQVALVPKKKIDVDDYILYEKLIQDFYTVDPNTTANSEMFQAEKFMEVDMKVEKNTEGPQILIYHTHSQEAFADSIKGDTETSIVGVGQHLADLLTDVYGYRVLHHTGEYDKKTRDDAYTRALPEIEKILKENPSIQVVIDLHRDEMPEKTRLVTEVDGKKTAKFMFFNGLSWSKKTGQISYLKNPCLQENLAFSFQLQKKANEYYPGLARRIYLKQYRYNMHVCPKATLIELGAQNNTVEEVMNACEPLAAVLDLVLRGEE